MHSSIVLWLFVLAGTLYTVIRRSKLVAARKAFAQEHGCQPPASSFPIKDPFGWTLMLSALAATSKHEMIQWIHGLHKKYGKTFAHQTWKGRSVFTSDIENIKCIHTAKFDDWEVKTSRQKGFKQLLGDGIFTTDGAFWSHSRAIIRPQFEKSQITELEQFEPHVCNLLGHIPKDGSTVDLSVLFHKLTMDSSMEFLTGVSTDSLLPERSQQAQEFVDAFETAKNDGMLRVLLGAAYFIWPHSKSWRATKFCRDYVESWVQRALKNKSMRDNTEEKPTSNKYVFINELAKHREVDVERIRNETMNMLMAGRDTTASLLTTLWFVLARQPKVFETLQNEVGALHGDLPTYEKLKSMNYVKYCVQEALRLYPPVPFLRKNAIRDTVIPRGGGPDGQQPIFMAEGSVIAYCTYALMRDPDVYGADAEEFKPERWADPHLRPLWGYIPFGGGARVCLGQNYALAEASYVTVRLVQNFDRLENRDVELDWKCELSATMSSYRGAKVALFKDA